MTFKDLKLSDKVLAAIDAAGYTIPTPIQAQAIPFALEGRDVVGIAQTGTGKTASFVLPLLNMLEQGRARARMPRSLILEPTRELAAQVAEAFETLGSQHKLTVALLIGGVSFDDQEKKLERGADILIATPGRLLDHFGRGKLLMNAVDYLVIDEADRMLDMGFIPDIERICKLLPPSRQTLFFSATMPPEIQKLTDQFLKNPEQVRVSAPATAAKNITQKLKFSPADSKTKRHVLRELMRSEVATIQNAIIFCNRKRDVAVLHKSLVKHGFNAGALHGDLDQRQRMATLEAFRKGEITYLAASDVAARGLDIPEVSHVFNFDVPISPEDYVHRIGRTGRAGRDGYAAMIVTPKEMKGVRAIENLCKAKIEWIDGEPSTENLAATDFSERRERSRRGERGGAGRGRSKEAVVAAKPRETAEVRPIRQETPSADDARPMRAASTSTAERPARNRRNGDGSSVSRYHRELLPPATSAPVVGLGDHVPAFLMRPVRVAS
ncbi:DEAD/DEAH box helicase [Rhodomicrobium sp. Az07]|uniref:DEAD/DEAH box helicase n=1 Tax=Rhodomicrobium sp. Az07 TaxID=2839034 RepID=UPI001BE8AB37|nr:DEAD/DEAH box helicase [Rhodomicrobium sp. Az07]MBT3070545.1 DEAD/DEAH box helicase [Rhodomicrobium sp. Az07]